MTDTDQHEATPRAELERQIMDSNIPKNEREWWAAAEIERLRAALREIEHETSVTMLATNHGRRGDLANTIARAALEPKP